MITVCDISGMGGRHKGGYEWGCQVICLRALRFLERLQKDSPAPDYKQFKNVAGLAIPNGPAAEAMDKFILEHELLSSYGVTGAMHQYSINHAFKIHTVGREKYIEEARACRPAEDFYEFDERDAFPEDAEKC